MSKYTEIAERLHRGAIRWGRTDNGGVIVDPDTLRRAAALLREAEEVIKERGDVIRAMRESMEVTNARTTELEAAGRRLIDAYDEGKCAAELEAFRTALGEKE